ncbi:LuxR family two component transcriptional regulator [Salinisphaera sp. PC39]|uniref:response regulator transcription factor n=1 Tax=Salinisphaera sp. PC39 TaxID=1304156 RepID=UPI00334209DE
MATADTIIVADDHPLFRSALEQAVTQVVTGAEIVSVATFEALQDAIDSHDDADLLLLDLNMPGCRGYAGLVYARGRQPGLPVVVVSAYEDPQVVRGAIDHGASGFIPKSAGMGTIVEALTAVLDGAVWVPGGQQGARRGTTAADDTARRLGSLTPQQIRVLLMLTEGMLNKQIAIDLDISEATVKAHITAILRKLGVYTRTQAVIAARSLEIDWDALAQRALASDPDAPGS